MNLHFQTTHSDYQIRPATAQDAGDIARLFLISSDGLAAYIWDRDRAPGVELMDHGAARYARQAMAFSYENCTIVTSANRVIAMLLAFEIPVAQGVEEDPVLRPYSELEDPGSLYISGVAVDAEWRGKGIGSALLNIAENVASQQGIERLSLICLEANQAALRLYRRRGYTEINRRPIVPHPCLHYSEGDALLMRLSLSDPAR
jgi:ribosomal protein S18 acetylase RimI-like enzyme